MLPSAVHTLRVELLARCVHQQQEPLHKNLQPHLQPCKTEVCTSSAATSPRFYPYNGLIPTSPPPAPPEWFAPWNDSLTAQLTHMTPRRPFSLAPALYPPSSPARSAGVTAPRRAFDAAVLALGAEGRKIGLARQ